MPRRRSESKSGADIRRRGREQDVAADRSDLWSDDSGSSGAGRIAAAVGLPAGGLGVVMRLAEETGVVGPLANMGPPCFLGHNESGMTLRVPPFYNWEGLVQGVRYRDHDERLLARASGDRSGDHAAWNAAGFWWYDYDSDARPLGVQDVRTQGRLSEQSTRYPRMRRPTLEDYYYCVIRVLDWVAVQDPHSRDFLRVGYVKAFGIVGDELPEYQDFHGGDEDGQLLNNATHALVWFCGDVWPSPVETAWLSREGWEGPPSPINLRWTSLLGLIRTQNHIVARICHDAEQEEMSDGLREEVQPAERARGFGYEWGFRERLAR